MRKTNAEKIDVVVRKIMADIAKQGNNHHHMVVEEWKRMLGVTVANATRKIYVKDHKLFVYLDSPVIKQEIVMLKDKIKQYLNSKIPQAEIIDIILI